MDDRNRNLFVRNMRTSCLVSALLLTTFSAVASSGLPALPTMEGWTMRAPATDFPAGEVYKVIDGEVSLFLPYGLKQARFADYNGPESVVMTTEIYEMGSALDAYGIYSRCRSRKGVPAEVGAYGSVSSTQIVCCKGPIFARASVSAKSDSAHAALIAWAGSLMQPVADESLPPVARFMRLPLVQPGTDQYIAADLLELGILPGGYQAEVKLNEEKRCQMFVVPAPDEKAAQALKKALTGKLKAVETPPYAGGTHETLKGVLFNARGSLLVGLARLDTPAEGISLLENLLIGATANQMKCGCTGLNPKETQ